MSEKKLNVLGMDVFQAAAVKRSYQNIKSLVTKRNKILEKAENLKAEANEMQNMIDEMDTFTLKLTERLLGYRMSSEKCLYYMEHPEEWQKENTQENTAEPVAEEEPVENTAEDMDAEEDAEWESRIESGDLKTADVTSEVMTIFD